MNRHPLVVELKFESLKAKTSQTKETPAPVFFRIRLWKHDLLGTASNFHLT